MWFGTTYIYSQREVTKADEPVILLAIMVTLYSLPVWIRLSSESDTSKETNSARLVLVILNAGAMSSSMELAISVNIRVYVSIPNLAQGEGVYV